MCGIANDRIEKELSDVWQKGRTLGDERVSGHCFICGNESDDLQTVSEHKGNCRHDILVCWNCYDERCKNRRICMNCEHCLPKTVYDGYCFRLNKKLGCADSCGQWELHCRFGVEKNE